MSDNPFPTAPDPLVVAQWASLGRHALTIGGGALAAFGISLPSWLASLTDPQINIIISSMMLFGGAAMALVGVLKGRWDKWRARQAEVSAAMASATLGVPVTVNVTPSGIPNEAVLVPPAELMTAPSVAADVTPSPAPLAS